MTIRRWVWQWHWGSGVMVGAIVAMMALTGMVLALKPFVLSWVDTPPVVAKVTTPLPLATVLAVYNVADDQMGTSVTRYRAPHAPLRIKQKDMPGQWVNPYSSAAMGQESEWGRRFEVIESWHRWLGLTGVPRDVVRVIKAVACVWLIGLTITGVWLAWPLASKRVRRGPLAWHRWVGVAVSPLVVVMAITGIWLATEPVNPSVRVSRDRVQSKQGDGFPFEVAQAGIATDLPHWKQVTFRLGPQVSAMVQQSRWERTMVTFDGAGHIQRMTPRANWPKWIHTGEWAGQVGAIGSLGTAGSVLGLWFTGSVLVWSMWRKKR